MTELNVTYENVTKCGFGIRTPEYQPESRDKCVTNNLKAPQNNIISVCKLGSSIITNLDMSHMRRVYII